MTEKLKTIITSSGNETTAYFDKRFGRAAWFCVYDAENDHTTFIENIHLNDEYEAGIKAAELAMDKKVNRVISGHFGTKVIHLLDKNSIQMVIPGNTDLQVADIITQLKISNTSHSKDSI